MRVTIEDRTCYVMREYTNGETIIANIPYVAMIVMGASTIAFGFGLTLSAIWGALSYGIYGVVGVVWIMIFLCPYCAYFATRRCPCGYGIISARFVRRGDRECFAPKFKRHIPVIVPLWLIPTVCGIVALTHSFSWWLLGLTFAFVLNSYVVLPFAAMRQSCAECPQRDDCPWMSNQAVAFLRNMCLCGERNSEIT